ncbi:MAG: proline--tRNA ligase [Candidatus Wildermuthbacteria bacterium]|nr:proline--tRNA ligase [Candidatus Wildermuthbacteria bacterium]
MKTQEDKGKDKRVTPRAEDYSQWYLDVIESAELAEHAPVRGCMTIRPNGYAIWERIQRVLDEEFKNTGVQNAYFPLFIPESFFKKEAEHVKGFAPEIAVVTRAGGKELEEPLAVRPTSETIIGEAFSRWIQSHRDLPVLLNQWVNVVRWEMRTRLFLRTSEFLWQEGHTAHATEEDAEKRTLQMLEIYRKFAEEVMAVPVIAGIKSDSERFAGAIRTYTIEAMMQDGRALQSGTSHNLGQNFGKAFDVTFLDEKGERHFVWQTSWGVSTRLIGGLIMTHSDDKGLVLPPKMASRKVVIIPIFKEDGDEKARVTRSCKEIADALAFLGREAFVDNRDQHTPGAKFHEWEKKGIPVRIEVGPKDVEKGEAVLVRRDTGEKTPVPVLEIKARVEALLEDMQKNLFDRALEFQKAKSHRVDSYEKFKTILETAPGFLYAHWCGKAECEKIVKEETQATIRCIPFEEKEEPGACVKCGVTSKKRVLFAKAY